MEMLSVWCSEGTILIAVSSHISAPSPLEWTTIDHCVCVCVCVCVDVVYRFTDLSPLETDQSEGGEEAGEGGEDDNTLDLTLEGDTGAVCETSEGVTGDGGEGRDTGAVCETSEGGEGRDTGAMCETSEGVTGDGGEGRGYKRRLSEREGTPEVKRPALEGTADQPAPSENKVSLSE